MSKTPRGGGDISRILAEADVASDPSDSIDSKDAPAPLESEPESAASEVTEGATPALQGEIESSDLLDAETRDSLGKDTQEETENTQEAPLVESFESDATSLEDDFSPAEKAAIEEALTEEAQDVKLAVVSTKASAASVANEQTKVVTTAPERTYQTPFEAGVYFIQSSLAGELCLDVASASKKSGANVQVYTANKTDAQRWFLDYDKDGLYTIKSMASGKYLDLSNGKVKNTQNIWQYNENGTAAQKWIITSNGNGYTLATSKNKNYVIDVMWGKAKSGNNVQLYQANDTAAQRWWLIAEKAKVESERLLEDGVYEIALSASPDYVMDLSANSYNNSANIQLYKRNNTVAQRWAFTWESDGYYSVKNVSSAKPIDVTNGNYTARTNIQQYANNDTDAQRWAVQTNKNGSFTLVNKKSGMALDMVGAKAANGTNVRTFIKTAGKSQQLSIKPIDVLPSGVYNIYSMQAPTTQLLDIPSGSKAAGTVPQTWQRSTGSMNQKFVFTKTGANTYTIKALASNMALDAEGAKLTQQKVDASDKAQQWVLSFERNGVVLRNVETGKPISLTGAAKNGTKTQVANARGNAQKFRLAATNLVDPGCYIIQNVNGRVLDVSDGAYVNGANIQVYGSNKTGAQAFYIEAASGGYYRIINAKTFKALDVKNASTANGANVQQYASNGTAAQLWKPELDASGNLIFVSKVSGMALDVAGGGAKNGANVRQTLKNGSASQQWTLTPTSYSLSGDKDLDKKVANILGNITANDKLLAANNHVAGYAYRTSSHASGGNWTVSFAKDMVNQHSGNCYRYAALFQWLARGLGYVANAVTGYVPALSGGLAPHGWVEIIHNKRTYVCDPDMQHAIPNRNWYWQTYASAPVAYTKN